MTREQHRKRMKVRRQKQLARTPSPAISERSRFRDMNLPTLWLNKPVKTGRYTPHQGKRECERRKP